MIDPPNREIVILNEAVALPAAQRAAYLDQACGGDAQLRARVGQLLQAYEQAGTFLESPPQSLAGFTPPVPSEKAGDRIGRYKLLQAIGEGGCGVVYLAEQEEPVRRRVALKVIKPGMDTRSVISRFEAERQALALMDHPNIARVFDAGATESGRPYFVMELVRGVKITEYCDEHKLSTEERLKLFTQVCQAVQHAHQKGIIHRDLKPSNILVTVNDGVAVPKVIDFGIAKATQGRLTDHTVFTAFEQFLGTPAYMSPEQTEMTSLDVDTRSDIYSLGVLLYELLTGKTPFEQRELLAAGLDEMRRTIREREPPKPSTRLSSMVRDELTTTAQRRKTEPPKLILRVRGDLDWIVMRALEKDRNRRYETANGLARDIERHLNHEPITARPPSRFDRLQKAFRRHRTAFVAGAVIALALLAAAAISTWDSVRARRAEREQARLRQLAQSDEQRAQTEAQKSRQVAAFLQDMLQGVGPETALGRDTTMLREILERTRQNLHGELKDQPEVEAELRATLAGIYQQLGDYANAGQEYREALRLQTGVTGGDSTNVMQLVDELEQSLISSGELSAAEPMVRDELARSEKLFGGVHPAVASSLHDLAVVLWEKGDLAGADQLQRQALAQWRQFRDPKNISVALNDLGLVQLDRGDLAGAETSFRESLNLREGMLPAGHPALAIARNNLALALWYKGDLAGAEAMDRQALAMDRKLYPDGSLDTAATLNNLALVLRDRGDFTGAAPLQREALALAKKELGGNDPRVKSARDNLAALLRRQGAMTADPEILREALALDPADLATADALADLLEQPCLTPLLASSETNPAGWRWTAMPPATNWTVPDFSTATWAFAPVVSGAATFAPRTSKNPIIGQTNLWLRREFDLAAAPAGQLVFGISRNHDARIYLNGAEVMPVADWSDTGVLLPATGMDGSVLKAGRNVLAVQVQDADGGVPIDISIYVTPDALKGRLALVKELDQMIAREPGRAELYAGRAAILARLGRSREAAADLAKSIQLKPDESAARFALAPLLLVMDDLPEYRQLRHQSLELFATTDDPVVAARVAVLSLLVPAGDAELGQAGKLADRAARSEYADGYLGMRQLAEGLAAYRRGQFTNSVVWMDKVLATAEQTSLPGWSHERERNWKAAAYLIESMDDDQLHNLGAAQVLLNSAREMIRPQAAMAAGGDVGRDWPEWLMVQVLLSEAQSLTR